MINLVLMIDPFIPDSARSYLSSQDIFMLNFNFIPDVDFPFIEIPKKWMNIKQSDELLESIGLLSNSTFVNILNLILLIIRAFIIHIIFKFILR